MTTKKKLKEQIPMRKHPGDPEPESCAPGSIEQKLDMCEEGSLRGDDILHSHGKIGREYQEGPLPLDQVIEDNYQVDLSEENREGDEMSGDDHSSGFEGDEVEISGQPHINTGMPGDRTHRMEVIERTDSVFREDERIERLAQKPPSIKKSRRKVA